MSIITLTTDFGHKDYFVSVTKAALIQEAPEAMIVDISHEISPFNHTETAYILRNAYKSFPKGTVHIVGVDSELSPENNHIAMLFGGHYFIGANTLLTTFPVLDVFVKVAGHLSRNGSMDVIGKPLQKLKEIIDVKPVVNDNGTQIIGSVIYIDNFGNVVTNIKKVPFLEIQKTRPFRIFTQSVTFDHIFDSFAAAINFSMPKDKREEDGKKIAIWNAAGHLELAIYKSNPKDGNARSLFGLEFRTPVTIFFE